MVSIVSTTPNSKVLSRSPAPAKSNRAPLSPSRNDNNDPPPLRRPKSKNVTSRYLSSTPSSNPNTDTMTSSPSSSCSSTTTMSSPNSVCTPSRRFPAPVPSPVPVKSRRDQSTEKRRSGNLMKTFTRSLSVSFQGESFAFPVSKVTKPVSDCPPEKKKAPAMPTASFMTMSVDFADQKMKINRSEAVRALRKAITGDRKLKHNKPKIPETDQFDSDAVNDNVREEGRRAIVVPARFWRETINLLKRVQPNPVSPPLLHKNKPILGLKERGSSIPSPMRNNVEFNSNLGNTPSILSFSADSKRGKVGEKKLIDAHVLRLLHNKHLQWRFANARAEAAMAAQQATARKRLYNAWVTTSKLSNSIISKRIEIQQLKQNLKLHYVLKKQMSYLDNWDITERDHTVSLVGAITALESSSLCLPVLCGAKVNIQNLKDAVISAVDVMEAISVSICSLVTQAEHMNSLASELASAMKTECSLLDQCKDLFSSLTLLEMQDCSMRTHTLQLTPQSTQTQWNAY